MRLFIALDLPSASKARLHAALEPVRLADLPFRWIPLASFHLTLRFLGELDDGAALRVMTAMLEAAALVEPFPIRVRVLGAFPSLRAPRVLWAGIDAPPAMHRLRARLDERLLVLGHAAELKPFSPHVTIGRIRPGIRAAKTRTLASLATAFSFSEVVEIHEMALMESVFGADGVRYRRIEAVPLGVHQGLSADPDEGER